MILLAGIWGPTIGLIILVFTAALLSSTALWMFWPGEGAQAEKGGPFDDHRVCSLAEVVDGQVPPGTRIRVAGHALDPGGEGEPRAYTLVDQEGRSLAVQAAAPAGLPEAPGRYTWVAGVVT